ncbi:MAG: hypothetical protein HFACDABA_02822 [Anaerolineales bacterium]|nr:hypothetical protein [Anaerolineales bacterium]
MKNKLLIGLAAALLLIIVAAASFSAGLYLGQRGFVANLQSQPEFQPRDGQPPRGGGQPQGFFPPGNAPSSAPAAGQPSQAGPNRAGGPPGAPSWPPDAIGRIVSLSAAELILDTPNGPMTVSLSASTEFLNQDGGPATMEEFQPGDVIAIFGRPAVTAIMALPPPPNNAP